MENKAWYYVVRRPWTTTQHSSPTKLLLKRRRIDWVTGAMISQRKGSGQSLPMWSSSGSLALKQRPSSRKRLRLPFRAYLFARAVHFTRILINGAIGIPKRWSMPYVGTYGLEWPSNTSTKGFAQNPLVLRTFAFAHLKTLDGIDDSFDEEKPIGALILCMQAVTSNPQPSLSFLLTMTSWTCTRTLENWGTARQGTSQVFDR